MKTFLIHSFCKINLSLRVINKLSTKFHKIQSLVTFANIFDVIKIREINSNKDRIKFCGRFKYNINPNINTVSKTLNLLRKNNYLKKTFFDININKNIPHSAGLGGGSMNSSALLNFFLLTYKLNINKKKLIKIAQMIGSDVPLGLDIKNTFWIDGNVELKRFKNKLKLHIILVNPGIECSTEHIYFKNKQFSNPYSKQHNSNFKKLFNLKSLKFDRNDLEDVLFKQYPKLQHLRNFIKKQENCIFSRITGSGSTCVGYFDKLRGVQRARKNIEKKFPNYWCEIAKTI